MLEREKMTNPINKILIERLLIGVLVAGLVFYPLFTGQPPLKAQASDPPPPLCRTKHVLLIANETEVQIVDPGNNLYPGGIRYKAMTWNGTIPGPVIAVDQCDTLQVTVRNDGRVIHSMDFHAGYGPSNAVSGNIVHSQEAREKQ